MRVLILILNMLLFCMTLMPCKDGYAVAYEEVSLHEDDEHACGASPHCAPFCTCTCTPISGMLFFPVLTESAPLFSTKSMWIVPRVQGKPLTLPQPIWHPPQLG